MKTASLAIRSIIDEFQGDAPVRVNALAHSLGLKVFSRDLPAGISGKLYRSNTPSGWAIAFNRGEVKGRQRFTVAHEIGHYCLHREELPDTLTDDTFYRSSLSNQQEAEANAFAADVLMPWHLVRKYVDKGLGLNELAELFLVSEVAMKIRLGIPI